MGCAAWERGVLISLQGASAQQTSFAHTKSVRLHGLLIALALALLNGLLYLLIVPPWQHYDEPGHFEYAWLIANRPTLPQRGDFDQDMRLDVATSMIKYDFYRELGGPPNLLEKGSINIGLSQIDDYRTYYWLASLPLRLLRNADITLQLYAARAVSLLLLLVSIFGCWGILQELAHPDSALCWLIPISLALLPAYVDLMTAVNNDATAIAFATLLLWMIVRLIQRGFSMSRLIGCLIWAIVCFWTKSNTFLVIAGVPLALALSIFKSQGRKVIWAAITLAVVISLLYFTRWGDARGWLRLGNQTNDLQRATANAHSGQYAFALNGGGEVRQVIASDVARKLRGQTVTVGAWVWVESPQPQSVYAPVLLFENAPPTRDIPMIHATAQPEFHGFTVTVPTNSGRLWFALIAPQQLASATVLYDDIVLALGKFDIAQAPHRNTPNASDTLASGTWGDKDFYNLLRNPSAEFSSIRFNDSLQERFESFILIDINHLTNLLLDPTTTKDYFESTTNNLVQTFWARFGWGNVAVVYQSLYPLLNALIAASILCSLYVFCFTGILSQCFAKNKHALIVLTILTAASWGTAFARGVFALLSFWWIPSARYAYPTVVPTLLIIIGGWHTLAAQSPNLALRRGMPVLIVCFFVGLNALSLFSISHFFAR